MEQTIQPNTLIIVALIFSLGLNVFFAYLMGKKELDNVNLRCTLDAMQRSTDYYETRIALLELKIKNLQDDLGIGYEEDAE
jgi:hypothetical protein